MSQRTKGTAKTPATVALVPLKNCLSNLPQGLVSVLVNSNTPAQNVIIELSWRVKAPPSQQGNITGPATVTRQAFVGWTGMASKRAPQQGPNSFPGSSGARQSALEGCVEIDPAFAKNVGLTDGNKVNLILHVDPPLAHTIHIEPLTASDWEVIELHATFLELNLLSQIRALTFAHPLTVYLSPTSTASIRITRLEPDDAAFGHGFAKISPDAEVIVAPKTRQRRMSQHHQKSVKAQSLASTAKAGRRRDGAGGLGGGPVFFRGISLPHDLFDPADEHKGAYCVYLDPEVLSIPALRGCAFVNVIVVRPPGLAPPMDPSQVSGDPNANGEVDEEAATKPGARIVARLLRWENAPDLKHIAISPLLADALDIKGMVGGVLRIEAAHQQLAKTAMSKVVIRPYAASTLPASTRSEPNSLRWGGKDWKSDLAVRRVKEVLSQKSLFGEDILSGPLTDRLVLPPIPDSPLFAGGLLYFEPANNSDVSQGWILGGDRKFILELGPEITITRPHSSLSSSGAELPEVNSSGIVGVDKIIENVATLLNRNASVLLTGARGSGKSSLVGVIAQMLSKKHTYSILPVSCAKLADDRVQTIKDTLTRTFAEAKWFAPCVVVFDDLDRMIPAEQEHVDSTRSKWIAETFARCVHEMKQNSRSGSPLVVLATVQAKESINAHVVGGHVFREIISLKAPNKEGRRRVLHEAVYGNEKNEEKTKAFTSIPSTSAAAAAAAQAAQNNRAAAAKNLDLLDIAGSTDGYMPGDLQLLVGRARHEAVVRIVGSTPDSNNSNEDDANLVLEKKDFDNALKGFVPAGLRGVKLQTSGASWKDIGGLTDTRTILLETLEWPTKYAPIFANCPLRLRSGLLLYGYPGCGKTLLASAVAGECGLNFISVKGPEILNKYIGASEKSVRDLFERASAAKPCVLFFDEFDSIAPKRGHDSTGVTDRVVNQMLTQMDGAEGLDGVYVLAATSRPDLIDPALLRPGRLDKSLLCDLPSLDDRVDILRALAVKLKISDTVELSDLASRTEGYSGADLQAVLYNAHLDAIHEVIARQEATRDENAAARKDKSGGGGGGGASGNGKGGGTDDRIDFVSFTMKADDDDLISAEADDAAVRRKWLKERTSIVAKLETLNKQHKHSSSPSSNSKNEVTTNGTKHHPHEGEKQQGGQEEKEEEEGEDKDEVIITWPHLENSLRGTRPSIAPDERRRLNRIYREFIVGRSGDMPSGQSSSEIGGRSSLM